VPVEAPLVIVDAQSTAATVALARARGAEVIVRTWEGFVATRRFALARVATAWTFMLDADEVLDATAVTALLRAQPAPHVDGYTLARSTYFCGRPMRGGAWGGEAPLRLFRTAAARLEPHPAAGGAAEVHEAWSVPGTVERLPGTLHHYSYPTLATYRAKFARYTSLEARGARASWPLLLRTTALAVPRVPWLLFRRGGWRDGWRGVFVAVASAAYPVCVAVKALRA
jgi:hypothetical protein